MSIKHIVWDWNGTILNDMELAWSIMHDMLNKRGMPDITLQDYYEKLSFPISNYYEAVGFNVKNESMEELSIEFVAGFNAGWRDCGLQPGILDVIEKLDKSGIGQSILSASRLQWLTEQAAYYDVAKYFPVMSGRDDYHAEGKVYLAENHIKKVGLKGKEMLYIGDTVHDYHVAEKMGAKCILCEYGHQYYEKLSATGCKVARNADELFDFILLYLNHDVSI